jgi:hypothetical protein
VILEQAGCCHGAAPLVTRLTVEGQPGRPKGRTRAASGRERLAAWQSPSPQTSRFYSACAAVGHKRCSVRVAAFHRWCLVCAAAPTPCCSWIGSLRFSLSPWRSPISFRMWPGNRGLKPLLGQPDSESPVGLAPTREQRMGQTKQSCRKDNQVAHHNSVRAEPLHVTCPLGCRGCQERPGLGEISWEPSNSRGAAQARQQRR